MKDSSGSLRVCHVCSIMGERDDHRSNVNSSTARFITTSTGHDGRTQRPMGVICSPRSITTCVRVCNHGACEHIESSEMHDASDGDGLAESCWGWMGSG